MLVGVSLGTRGRLRARAALDELAQLVESAGGRVVESLLQERPRRDPATLVGSGKVEQLRQLCDDRAAELVVFDDDLSPAQQRNLEDRLARKTLDRTQLILD
ncbi:MAG TPA: GTPase HflX, partial [Vicinamibacteria bacterium]|nr:GTPase HflX [Vicinamibacteria bacterium]